MSQRKKRAGRCEGCGLHDELCLCARFPRVRTETALVVVQHMRETWKPTNTARLLAKMVEGTPILRYGMREPPFDAEPLKREDVDFFALYPREDAIELDPEGIAGLRAALSPGRRLGVVLLDGTWHQCSRMTRRVPVVDTMRCVALPPGPPSRWGVRTQHDIRGLSTFEAGVRALGLLEGDERVAPLRAIFFELAARLQFMKGKLRRPEVPDEWWADAQPSQ